jgi:hypothetical protein
MKKQLFLFTLVVSACFCNGQIIDSPTLLEQMILKQEQVIGTHAAPWLFLQKQPMQQEEKLLMEYLYAYMPLSDLVTYSPSFFDANVKQTIRTKQEMNWGTKIPKDIFLHFVLPLRVNNEPLDSFRLIMYPELKKRVQGLSMETAALEINHWCHEKVSYRGSDARTGSPMSLLLRAFGRCGEESTFTVAALRTVGIPARQVYTPRWEHTDDNHAWVEVWIDGKWNYMGACEPEPCLNRAWFSEPVKRAMFIHTYTYGPDSEDSLAICTSDHFSELNLTSRYASTKSIVVKVIDTSGYPVDSAKVECRLFNYAEFYPVLRTHTNAKGEADVTLGKGDLLIRAVKDHLSGFKKLNVQTTDTLVLTLTNQASNTDTFDYDLTPPPPIAVPDTLSANLKEENNKRLQSEDSIRHAYISTFKDAAWAKAFANQFFLSSDTVCKLIGQSYGNWPQVTAYLARNAFIAPAYLLALATQLSEKDLSDLNASIITDHLLCATKPDNRDPKVSENDFIHYVLSPRISTETITPWRSFLINHFGPDMARACRQDISPLIRWIATSIRINRTANEISNILVSPENVYTYRVADNPSRDLFFVAACRSFGIPARLNPVTNKPEYMKNDQWYGVNFHTQESVIAVQGKVKLLNCKNIIIPQYDEQFTIAQLHSNGNYHTLTFDWNRKVTDFSSPMVMDTGHYVLVVGNRLCNDKVLSFLTFFHVTQGTTVRLPVTLRRDTGMLHSLGNLDLSQLHVQPLDTATTCSLSSVTSNKKDIVLILLDPGQEPSRHVLNDLAAFSDRLQDQKIMFFFVITPSKIHQTGILSSYSLPTPNLTVVDQQSDVANALHALFPQTNDSKLPIVVFCDNKGTLFFKSSGYTMGIGDQLLNVQEQLHKVNIHKEDKDFCKSK